MTPRDEPLLERELARRRRDPRPQAVVGRGDEPRFESERLREPRSHGGQRLTSLQGLRAHEVQAEIAVAQPEPRFAAELRDGRERIPRLVGAAPAAFLVVQIRQRVQDRVEVRRHVHAEHLEVVADVSDHRHLSGIGDVDEAAHEPRASDAARQHNDPHVRVAAVSSARHACERGPSLRCSRCRSSSVSTSSARFGTATETGCRPRLSTCARKRAALSGP